MSTEFCGERFTQYKRARERRKKRIIHIRSGSHDAKVAQNLPQIANKQPKHQQRNTRMIKINADILSIFGVFHVEHVRTHTHTVQTNAKKL